MLQCVAVCCSAYQYVEMCSSVLQCLQCVTLCCSVYQNDGRLISCVMGIGVYLCVAVCIRVLQCVAMCCGVGWGGSFRAFLVLACVCVCCTV